MGNVWGWVALGALGIVGCGGAEFSPMPGVGAALAGDDAGGVIAVPDADAMAALPDAALDGAVEADAVAPEACAPVTACSDNTQQRCGDVDDGCGGKVQCGACEVTECYSAFKPNVGADGPDGAGHCGCWRSTAFDCSGLVPAVGRPVIGFQCEDDNFPNELYAHFQCRFASDLTAGAPRDGAQLCCYPN